MPRWVEIAPEAVLELAPANLKAQGEERRAGGRFSHAVEAKS